ncbi:MAG: methyltransferase [Thermoplasmata archaeon]|nr:MAG: methyltransferase [Thermoplasmata archaeon]
MKIKIFEGVYEPSDDTYMLARNLEINKGDKVLDMGTGCGILAIIAYRKGASKVVACDINKKAVECAKYNVTMNNARVKVIESDLFENIREKFDLIIFNPPYLPSDPLEKDDELKIAWDGGKNGREVIDRFIDEVEKFLKPGGRFQIVVSSLSGIEDVIKKIDEKKFEIKINERKRFFFEELVVITGRLKR